GALAGPAAAKDGLERHRIAARADAVLRQREEQPLEVRPAAQIHVLSVRRSEPRAVLGDDQRVGRRVVARDRLQPGRARERTLESAAHQTQVLVVFRGAYRVELLRGARAMT